MPTGLRADKREAIIAAARSVFGRDGYARANIDAIAQTAGVSTRTVYKHFEGGKEALFSAVIAESATRVSDHLVELVRLHLGEVPRRRADLERQLVDLGREWVLAKRRFPDHFAMVRHITVEAPHFPQQAFTAWQEAGPRRAERELAEHLRRLDADGRLRIHDADLAAEHLLLLTAGAVSGRTIGHEPELPHDEVERIVVAGVATFLDGYRIGARGRA